MAYRHRATGPEQVAPIDGTWERVIVPIPGGQAALFARVRVALDL